jgi:hypothetical protein
MLVQFKQKKQQHDEKFSRRKRDNKVRLFKMGLEPQPMYDGIMWQPAVVIDFQVPLVWW